MNKIKYTVLLAALCAGMTSLASATLTLVGTFTPANESPQTVQDFFNTTTGDNAIDCLRTGDNGVPITGTFTTSFGGTITISSPSTGVADITFDMTGTGQVICGFFIFGGGAGNLYTVSADEGVTGTFEINTPVNPSGGFAGISHIDIFCCVGAVPDGGTTVMLLGAGLSGLGLVRRFVKR